MSEQAGLFPINQVKVEPVNLTEGGIHDVGTLLTIPIDDDEYMVYRMEITHHWWESHGQPDKIALYLDRYNSHPEHKTVYQSASAYLSVDAAKQIMQALQQAIKEADDE